MQITDISRGYNITECIDCGISYEDEPSYAKPETLPDIDDLTEEEMDVLADEVGYQRANWIAVYDLDREETDEMKEISRIIDELLEYKRKLLNQL